MNRKRILYWVVAVVVATMSILCAFHFDEAMRNYIAVHQDPAVKTFMRNVSRFGDWPEHLALGIIGVAIAWWRGNTKWTRIFLLMLLACALAGTVARGIKIATGRARPSVKSEEGWNGPRLSSKYHAFPSGHTAASAAFLAALFLASWRIGLAFLPVPMVIALSRMYVAAHYLSDVVCAAILGITCAIVVRLWFDRQADISRSSIGP